MKKAKIYDLVQVLMLEKNITNKKQVLKHYLKLKTRKNLHSKAKLKNWRKFYINKVVCKLHDFYYQIFQKN